MAVFQSRSKSMARRNSKFFATPGGRKASYASSASSQASSMAFAGVGI
jgi:hypothetical protein